MPGTTAEKKTEQEVTTDIMPVLTMLPMQLLLQPLLSIPKVVPTLLPLEKSVFMSKTPGGGEPSFYFEKE